MIKLGWDAYNLNKLLAAIEDATDSLDFSIMLAKLKAQNNFKYSTHETYDLSKRRILDTLVIACYRLVMAKYADEKIVRKQASQTNQYYLEVVGKLSQYLQNQSGIIKQQYCYVMQNIRQRKGQEIQFILFIIFFSFKDAFTTFCKKFQILKQCYFQLVQKQNDQLEELACAQINFQIIGITIKSNIYKSLKKKYHNNAQKCIRRHKKANTATELTPLLRNLIPLFVNEKHQQNKQKMVKYSSHSKRKQFKNQIKLLLQKQNNQVNKEQQNKIQNLRQSNSSNLLNQKSPVQNFGFISFGNSDAFKKIRQQTAISTKKKQNESPFCKNSKKRKLYKGATPQNWQNKMIGLNLLNASLKLFLGKAEKKTPLRQNEKCSVAEWQNKLNCMKNQGGIEKVSLKKTGQRKWRKGTYGSQEQLERNFQNFSSTSKKPLVAKRLQSQRQSISREGFCEFIDQRQPSQIGIVRSIVNFSNNTAQKQHKKLCCKQIKGQYVEFNNKMQQHYNEFIDENNYMYRLQKALTGTNKF